MQTLGLSEATERTDGRLKSLFWPSVKTSSDVDYLGSQGLWVCSAIGVLSAVMLTIAGSPIVGLFVLLMYYLAGVGVREGSRYAAGWAFVTYFGDIDRYGAARCEDSGIGAAACEFSSDLDCVAMETGFAGECAAAAVERNVER